MTALNPYPDRIDSGVEWLGEVPEHWLLEPLGKRFVERKMTVSDADFPPLSVTRAGIVPQLDDVAKTENGDSRKLVKAGDFAINSRSDRKGSSGLADRDGSVSVITTVVTPRAMDSRYVHHLLRSFPFQEEYYRFGSGIVADLWSTRWPAMKGIRLAVPPADEQAAISAFLDRETAEIDAFIADQEELIGLLAERRAATITHAVTEGLDPSVPTKDSGMEWLGAVPENWQVSQVRRLHPSCESGTSVNGYTFPAGDGDIGVLKTGSVSKGYFDPRENKQVADYDLERVTAPVRPDSLLINRANSPELVGAGALVRASAPGLFLSDKLWQLDFEGGSSAFVYYWTQSSCYRAQISFLAVGASASMQNLSYSDFLSLAITYPSLPEQRRITDYLDREIAELDAAIADARESIALSKERRASLISAAVTGKIDVRGMA